MSSALGHLGIWLGGLGWVIGFALITLPDSRASPVRCSAVPR
jgi:hypothetical protein